MQSGDALAHFIAVPARQERQHDISGHSANVRILAQAVLYGRLSKVPKTGMKKSMTMVNYTLLFAVDIL